MADPDGANDVNLEDLMKVSMAGDSQNGKGQRPKMNEPFTIGAVSNDDSEFLHHQNRSIQ